MTASLRNALYLFVTGMAIATAAGQPAEDSAARAEPQVDPAAQKVGDQIEMSGDKREATAEHPRKG
jgi:hypothetical protein